MITVYKKHMREGSKARVVSTMGFKTFTALSDTKTDIAKSLRQVMWRNSCDGLNGWNESTVTESGKPAFTL